MTSSAHLAFGSAVGQVTLDSTVEAFWFCSLNSLKKDGKVILQSEIEL
jgi:hypothetical protein